jgi:hypothetical protein
MQKKQNLPRSRSNPRLMPIIKEIGAFPGFSFDDRRYAVERSASITRADTTVLSFSLFDQAKPAVRFDPELLAWLACLLLIVRPKQFLQG